MQKSIHAIQDINRLTNKNLMILSINVENEFHKVMIKTLSNLGIERNYLNLIKEHI